MFRKGVLKGSWRTMIGACKACDVGKGEKLSCQLLVERYEFPTRLYSI
jgi:hypothetical protein